MCQSTVEILEKAQRERAEAPPGKHQVVAVAWPGASWHVKFVCARCRQVAGHSYLLKPACGRTIRPTKYIDELKPIATGAPGTAADGARRILDYLGYAWQEEAAVVERQQLAQALGQGGTPCL